MTNAEVWLKVYDLSEGKAAAVSPLILRNPIRGVWHSSIEVFGYEYFYGGYIERLRPHAVEAQVGLSPDVIKLMGVSQVSKKAFERFLVDIDHDFTPETYDLIEWNCNHFADVCARFLLNGEGIPKSLLRQPNEVSRNILGRAILGLIELAHRNPVEVDSGYHDAMMAHGVPGEVRQSFRPRSLQERVEQKRSRKNSTLQTVAGAIINPPRWIDIWPFNTCGRETDGSESWAVG